MCAYFLLNKIFHTIRNDKRINFVKNAFTEFSRDYSAANKLVIDSYFSLIFYKLHFSLFTLITYLGENAFSSLVVD